MTDAELDIAALKRGLDAFDAEEARVKWYETSDEIECVACGGGYSLTPGLEPTALCNHCPHELVPRLITALESARRERDALREKVDEEVEYGPALDRANLRTNIALEERDTARAEAEQLRAERDALAARICKRCNSCIGDCATLQAVEDTQNETAEAIATWLDDWGPTVGEARSLICDAAKDPDLILFTTSDDDDYIGTTDISFENTCLAIMAALRSGEWRTTKGDAGK